MKIDSKKYRVPPGTEVILKKWRTRGKPHYKSKTHYQALLHEHTAQVSKLQTLLYADNRHALLLIFQAMDGAGKDGALKNVITGVNTQGCQSFRFKHPSPAQMEHDFLWRTS